MSTKIFFSDLFKQVLRQFIPNIGTVLVVAALLFANNVRAASLNAGTSPNTISYEGTLATASGTVVNASVGITFRLYNVQSGGTAFWTESHTGATAVPVSNGLFNILLGSITPIPSTVWDNASVYLGVQVEGDSAELLPREVVSAVPMAMMTANITVPDSSIITTKIANGAVTSNKTAITYWNITNSNQWQTTVANQYVEAPPYNFTFTPQVNGVVFLNLNLTFSESISPASLFCAIFVNNSLDDGAKSTVAYSGTWEHCGTSLAYSVQTGQTYRFAVNVYQDKAGTLTLPNQIFTQFNAVFFGTP